MNMYYEQSPKEAPGSELMEDMNGICDHIIQLTNTVAFYNKANELVEREYDFSISGSFGHRTLRIKSCRSFPEYLSEDFVRDMENYGVIFTERRRKANVAKLRNILLRQYRETPEAKVVLLEQGVSSQDGKVVCVIGDKILSSGAMNGFTPAKRPYQLYKTEQPGEFDIGDILAFMSVDDTVCPLLTMYAVFSVLQGYLPLFGINERFLLVIEGKTGELKSSSAKVATDIFQRGPSVSLSSTKTAILENLWQFGNIPVLLDDYNKSSFTHTMRSKGITLSEIIQSYYDRNTIQKMDGKQMKEYSIQSGIVITTEGMPKNISTLNRCLIVSSEGAIDSKRLKAAQERNRQKHMFSGLVMDLNMYLVKHLDQLQNMVRSNFLEFRDGSAALPRKNSDGTVNRVKNTYALAMTAAYVFQQYMGYKKLNPQTLNKVYRTMQQAVQSACLDMCDLMSPGEPSHEYIDCIDNIYDRDWSEKAVKNPKKYFKMQNYHSGILSEDSSIFYIQGQKLIESLQRELEKPVTKKAVSQELRDFGFLAVDADGKNSTRLPGFGTTYRTRFYAIRIKMLQEWCRDTFWETLNDEMRQEEMTR